MPLSLPQRLATLAPDEFILAAARTSSSSHVPLLARPEAPPWQRMLWPAALILVFAAILLVALAIVRRRMRQFHQPPPLMRGFTLEDLRQLKREGKLTDEEFEKAKAKILANVQRSLAKPDAKPDDALNVEVKE